MDRTRMTMSALTRAAPTEPPVAPRNQGDPPSAPEARTGLSPPFWIGPMDRMSMGWNRLTSVLLLVAILAVLATFSDYGVTWDEDVHNWYGVFVLDYYLSLFKDGRCLHWQDLFNYGAAFDMTAAAVNRISPFGTYETRHLLNGLVGVLGLLGCAKLAR